MPRKKGARRRVSGFGRPPELMWAAVLIIAGGRPHYYDRPPVTEFYTLYSIRYAPGGMIFYSGSGRIRSKRGARAEILPTT